MPHSISPPASPTIAQEDSINIVLDARSLPPDGMETDGRDIDTNPKGGEQKAKAAIKLEALFDEDMDDYEDDEEFPSSTGTNGKVESSPPAVPLYAWIYRTDIWNADSTLQGSCTVCKSYRSRGHASFLPTPLSFPLPFSVAQPLDETL